MSTSQDGLSQGARLGHQRLREQAPQAQKGVDGDPRRAWGRQGVQELVCRES